MSGSGKDPFFFAFHGHGESEIVGVLSLSVIEGVWHRVASPGSERGTSSAWPAASP